MSEAYLWRQPLPIKHRGVCALADRLRDASAVTPELVSDVIGETCWRLSSMRETGGGGRIEQLIQAGAWTDVALVLLELELPQWQIRRIAYDAGEWHCALSRQRELPDWLDQSVETSHANLAVVILSALVDARRERPFSTRTSVPAVACADTQPYTRLCCDNFA
jgi:hypothetical protein